MLTEIYIEVLLVDEELADKVWKVWKAWSVREIDDLIALRAWWWIVVSGTHKLRPPAPPQIWIGASTFFAAVRNRWARCMKLQTSTPTEWFCKSSLILREFRQALRC